MYMVYMYVYLWHNLHVVAMFPCIYSACVQLYMCLMFYYLILKNLFQNLIFVKLMIFVAFQQKTYNLVEYHIAGNISGENLAVWPPRRYVVMLTELKFGG